MFSGILQPGPGEVCTPMSVSRSTVSAWLALGVLGWILALPVHAKAVDRTNTGVAKAQRTAKAVPKRLARKPVLRTSTVTVIDASGAIVAAFVRRLR